ncbi:hypothetical protein MAELSTROM_62 [Pseudoalteromonas phage Maelstrom]|uniref:hypothetical protein n=1 Tax=Pseudoalteromonas phage Maelstrom TaxID=2065202 RepID=UPI000CA3416E|nr:hypothetical protein PP584_gp62 [Pseudoalteromonas phage Maelstrom]AUG84981.1 hypothetical protein MAELSTROM_62 [Pseudoalteromonas phage Maelstrom]
MKTANTEVSTANTDHDSQEAVGSDKINLPSLPDAFNDESLVEAYKRIEKEAKSEVPDIETEEGRKNIKEMARKVAASKTAIDTPIRDYLRMIKAQPKVLEKSARESKARFDKLKEEILKPLTEAQSSQDAVIEWLGNIPALCSDPDTTSAHLAEWIDTINGYTADLVWPELKKKFKVAHENALTTATVTLERIVEAEKKAAELAELREKQAAAEQAEYNRKIAEEAAAKAREEAEAKAQREREAAERRAVEAKQREEAAKAAEQKAIRDAELAREEQDKAMAQYEIDSEKERVEAEKRQALAVEQAKQAEAKRIADEEAAQQQAAKDREADKAHKIAINRAALVDLVAAGVDEETAKTVIRAIGRKEVRNISIQY